MTYIRATIAILLLAQLAFVEGVGGADEPVPGFAVVELFTSQGCSSCPPADAVLQRLSEQAEQQALPVYALSFHVDYWDRLGWKDPFSQAAFSQRQRAYAAAFRSNRVYTPQMVVNGNVEFVGSSESRAKAAVAAALRHPARGRLLVTVRPQEPAQTAPAEVAVRIEHMGLPVNSVVNVALVERRAVTKVPRGENAGRELKHANVVRAFETVQPKVNEAAQVRLVAPPGMVMTGARVVVYAQDARSMAVHCAATAAIAVP